MRLETPRIPLLRETEADDETRELLARTEGGRGRILNIFATLARHPKLMKRWLVFGNHILYKSTLPPREREIAILRTGWLCRSEYEWGQHVRIGRSVGLSDEEISRIASGPEHGDWPPADAALLQAVDELHTDSFVSDDTWTALKRHFDTRQLMDLVFTVGQYTLVSMALNTFGVQLDDGVATFSETVPDEITRAG